MTQLAPSQLIEAIALKERELDALRRELATHRTAVRLPEGPLALVRCTLAGEHIAFVQHDVDEIVGMAALTELPESPPWLMGLLQLGNERIPIIDLVARESGRRREPDPSELIVLTRSSRGRFGLVIDELDGLVSIDSSSVGIPTADVVFASHILGVASIEGRQTMILAVEPLTPEDVAPDSRR